MKIAVFGSNGMAGHMLVNYLKNNNFDVITIARDNADCICDVENINAINITLSKLYDCDFVINCIGFLVKDSIDRPDRAAIINGWFPHYLEHWFKSTNTKIIHLSTDCVFDGKKGQYVESDIHTEINAYGKSKSYGEINNAKDVTFRMSIIGPEIKKTGTGLLHWVTTNPSDTLNGFTDALWNGITTLQLAKCIHKHLLNPKTTGVYHLVNNSNSINKYDLLCLINEIYKLNKTIVRSTGPKIVNKILIDTRCEMDWEIADYRSQLVELKAYIS
jgi:dTDP-4-dehydrorhamnose reductase